MKNKRTDEEVGMLSQLYSRRELLKGMGAAGVGVTLGSNLLLREAIGEPGSGGSSSVYARPTETGWQPKKPPLTTPWTGKVSPNNDHPEYPRPQMVRERWLNLNGVWQFAAAGEGEAPPVGRNLSERILVPFPVESALSGIMRHESRMWYRRRFTVPRSWRIAGRGNDGQRLLLHFDSVDYETKVWVNGKLVGTHKGGYDRFTFDVTDVLRTDRAGKPSGEQEIVVGVYDPTDDGGQPLGKQRLNPGGIFYTPISGIWKTVWMEPVSGAYVERLDMTPDLGSNALSLTVRAANAEGKTAEATAYDGNKKVGTVSGPVDQELRLPVPNPKLWSPDSPFLYDLKVRLLDGRGAGKGQNGPDGQQGGRNGKRGGKAADEVKSYFGMRSISLGDVNGEPHMLLNGKFVFELGTLDQGFWPDGIHTAPTEDALKFDLEQQKKLGFNTVRKHIKVEPDRWFYHADRLGLIVWQDMPAMPTGKQPTPADQQEFEKELRGMIDQHRSFTSVVMWVPFNEGWGAYDTTRIANMVKSWDPSRLVDEMSGSNVCGCGGSDGDVLDLHNYVGPEPAPEPGDGRAGVIGEFGGLGLHVEGHEWDSTRDDGFAYEMEPDAQTLTDRYVELLQRVRQLEVRCGLSAAIYTQPTDVEDELNGLFTYDRKVLKPDAGRVRNINEAVIAASGQVVNPPPPPAGTPGLIGVGFWPFEEGSGNTTRDASGNGHDATLINGPTWIDGYTGKALQFNGQDQWVDTGDSILDTTANYSAAAWVWLDRRGGFATAVSQDGSSASEFFLQYSGADDRFAFSSVGTRALAPAPPQTGRWYHLVGVRDVQSEKLKLYVDGQLAGTTGYCPGFAANGNTVIGRGKFGGNPVDFWPGKLDQVHVYDRALSDAEIKELYESGK